LSKKAKKAEGLEKHKQILRENPHILLVADGLKIASWTGTRWAIQTLATQNPVLGVLALDKTDNPHVAYIDGKELNYAYKTRSNWNTQIIETSSEFYGLYIALDSNNAPYILYSPTTYSDLSQNVSITSINLKLAAYQNSSWNIQTISLPSRIGDYGNLVIDSKDFMHFICAQRSFLSSENMTLLSTILYASWDGTTWTTETVVSDTILLEKWLLRNVGFLELDETDNPHISYVTLTSPTQQSMKYASWTGTNWKIQTVNTNITAKQPSYLAVDANSNPHMSYLGVGPNQSFIWPITTLVYATINTTEADGTQPSSPVSETPDAQSSPVFSTLPLVLAPVICSVVAVIVLVYVWKKKNPTHANKEANLLCSFIRK